MQVQPYLFFNGNCEEAIAFYTTAIGAQLENKIRFSESPDPAPPGMIPPGFENKIMHAAVRIGDSVVLASDGCEKDAPAFQGFSLTLSVTEEADADRAFNALADGGKITMPLTKTFWSPRFGMLTDKYGINWMINCDQPHEADKSVAA